MKVYNTHKHKSCWVATQTSVGWRIAFHIDGRSFPIRGLQLKDRAAIDKMFERACVFVYTCAGSKELNDARVSA